MSVTGIFTAILVGLVLGVVGRILAPGKQNIPIWLTILVGVVAALIGTLIVQAVKETSGFDLVELIVQIVLATLGVIGAARLYPSKKRR